MMPQATHHHAQPPIPPRPFFLRFLAAIAVVLVAAANNAEANPDPFLLTFERNDDGQAVTITLTFTGDADGTSEITPSTSNWGGFPPEPADFTGVAAYSGRSSIPVTTTDGLRWSFSHPPSAAVTFTYTLREPPPPGRESLPMGRNDYRTAVRPDLFRMFGPLGILYPEHLRNQDARLHDIRWNNFDRPGFVQASSFGDGHAQSVTTTAERFINSVFVAGRLAASRRDINGGTLAVLLSGEHWDFSSDELADLAAIIIRAQRDFFNDHSHPWYLVCVTPNGPASPGSFSLGGTALTNAFALFCDPGTSLRHGSRHLPHVQRLLAHEYFHSWNGVAFRVRGDEGANYWFSEGFTDYFTRRMLRLAGLWNDHDLLADLNDSIARHDANPARHTPYDQVIAAFWSDRHMADLPYRRGDLAALALDQAIRRRSGASRSLDDAFRDLLRSHQGSNGPDQQDLFQFFEREAGNDLAESIRSFILEGGQAPLPDSLDEFNATLTTASSRSTDPGFDLDASREQRRLAGVQEGSAAHVAGLRDGMPFRRFSLGADPDKPADARVEVEIDGDWMTIRYEALGPGIPIRVYTTATKTP